MILRHDGWDRRKHDLGVVVIAISPIVTEWVLMGVVGKLSIQLNQESDDFSAQK